MAAPTLGQAPLWYLSRSTGIVSFVLMTLTLCLGIASTQRALASPGWPRFATQGLHRNVSLLALGFLGVHIVSTIADSYVSISWWAAVLPTSAFQPLGQVTSATRRPRSNSRVTGSSVEQNRVLVEPV